MRPRHFIGLLLLAIIPWTACTRVVRQPPSVPPEIQKPDLRAHLLGSWELPSRSGPMKKMIFEPDGRVTFRGGLEFYNPATWELDPARKELRITFPNAPNEKLDVFHTYVGDGVKAFHRAQKEVVYNFDETTWSLNIAGWTYSKPDQPAIPRESEPVFK